jgi:hypothetical protein
VHKCTKRNMVVRLPSNGRRKYADEPSRSLRSLPSLFCEKLPAPSCRWMENGRLDFILCICARRGTCALDTIPLAKPPSPVSHSPSPRSAPVPNSCIGWALATAAPPRRSPTTPPAAAELQLSLTALAGVLFLPLPLPLLLETVSVWTWRTGLGSPFAGKERSLLFARRDLSTPNATLSDGRLVPLSSCRIIRLAEC